MTAIRALLAAGLFVLLISPARAEECVAASTGADGEPKYTTIVVDLSGTAALDRAALPERASGLMCRRASIIPMPEDVRVLIEWAVPIGLAEDGPRALWISASGGRLQITVEDGELSAAEKAAVDDWLAAAQARFASALATAERHQRN